MLKRKNILADVVYDPEPQTIEHTGLRALYDYWDGRRSGGGLPGRQDLDPLDIPALLPHLMLIDVVAPESLRFRLVGTALVGRWGRDTTGLSAEHGYPGGDWEQILSDYRYVIGERRPCLRHNAVSDSQGNRHAHQRLVLPLARDGKSVDMILAAAFWFDAG